jgi:saccharopine dehydrogenase (NAD+, L-lysine-forming)
VVINNVNYYFNCQIMEACLEAGVHYIDIGGLYVETVKQMKYHEQFKEAGLIAIPGIGGTPGLTNVSARWAADRLDTVSEINFYCGSNDWSTSSKVFDVSYAIETIMDEFVMRPIEYLNGELVEIEPGAGGMMVQYPEPVGRQYAFHTMHSEIATVPDSFRDKGLHTCTFRVGFPDDTMDKFKLISGLGFNEIKEIEVDGVTVNPMKVLKKLMELQPEEAEVVINDCDIIKTEVKGTKDGVYTEYVVEAVCRPNREWPELLGAQVYIGGAPSWAAQMLLRGQITGAGVLAPEVCIPPEIIFAEAAKREIYFFATQTMPLGGADWNKILKKQQINQWE